MTTQYIKVPGIGSIYRRNKIWYLDYVVDGIRIREKASGNKEAAFKLLTERASEAGQAGAPPKKKIVPFSDFADEYLELKANGPKPRRSIRSIRGYVSHLKAFFGDRPLARITPELVEEYQRTRAEDAIVTSKKKAIEDKKAKTPARKMKGASINREVATLRNIFNIARKKKLFRGDNPASGLAFFSEQKRRHYVLSLEEYAKLINAAEPNFRPIIQVAVRTGLRKNDILSIKRRDIDHKRKVLTAWVSKTQEWQSFRLGDDLAAILKGIPGISEYLFTNPKTGTKWNDIKKWWEAAKKEAGLDAPGLLRFHDLRANAGIRVEEKAGAYAAQVLLGHKSPKTTQLYLDLTPERAQAAAQALADFFKVTPEARGTNAAQVHVPKTANASLSTH